MFVSVERAVIGILAVIVFATAFAVGIALKQPNAPVSQPSVPSLIPPPLSCLCGTARQASKPFVIVCPYCKGAVSVQPSASGSTPAGQVVGYATPAAKPAK